MSSSCSSHAGSAARWERFSRRPVARLSTIPTRNPSASSRSTMWLPIKPAPPVTTAYRCALTTRGNQVSRLLQPRLLDRLYVDVGRIGQRVGQLPGLEGATQVHHRVLDRPLRRPSQLTFDLLRRDVVGA